MCCLTFSGRRGYASVFSSRPLAAQPKETDGISAKLGGSVIFSGSYMLRYFSGIVRGS